MSPQTRLRRRFSSGEANSAFTLLQSHSSSSATSIGSAVKLPWPISDLATRMITVSSGSITIQAVISGAGLACLRAARAERNVEAERQRAAGAATLARNERRFIQCRVHGDRVHGSSRKPQLRAGGVNRR